MNLLASFTLTGPLSLLFVSPFKPVTPEAQRGANDPEQPSGMGEGGPEREGASRSPHLLLELWLKEKSKKKSQKKKASSATKKYGIRPRNQSPPPVKCQVKVSFRFFFSLFFSFFFRPRPLSTSRHTPASTPTSPPRAPSILLARSPALFF